MTILVPRASTSDAEFQANRASYETLLATLHERRRKAMAGGPAKAREKLGWTPEVSFEQLVVSMVEADLKLLKGEHRL